MILRLLAAACAVSAAAASAAGECRIPLDRPYTLRNRSPFLVEAGHGRMAMGEAPLAFAFPRPVGSACDDSGPSPLLAWRAADSATDSVALGIMAGEEFRQADEAVWATEAGALLAAAKGPVSARLDARMFVEAGGDPARPGYDRESTDDQDDSVTGSVDYRSYARFRGDLNLDLPIGRFTVARDAAHWGPGLYGNAVLSQDAVPYYQYVFSTRLGPLSVTSLYGDLQIDPDQNATTDGDRSLYAHRYELAMGPRVLVGLSEQIILHDLGKPYLFAPIFPLFIAKGMLPEAGSNGNMAVDAAWRAPGNALLYAEFMLDDLESPTSLIAKDYVQNKWAALAGTHVAHGFGSVRAGAIAEFSHVEPWVYSHFKTGTAQAANLGLPIGNPFGPDSRTLILKGYARGGAWYAGLKVGLYWKGEGAPADLESPTPTDPLEAKVRLAGDSGPRFALDPSLAWNRGPFSASLDARIGKGARAAAALRIFL